MIHIYDLFVCKVELACGCFRINMENKFTSHVMPFIYKRHYMFLIPYLFCNVILTMPTLLRLHCIHFIYGRRHLRYQDLEGLYWLVGRNTTPDPLTFSWMSLDVSISQNSVIKSPKTKIGDICFCSVSYHYYYDIFIVFCQSCRSTCTSEINDTNIGQI